MCVSAPKAINVYSSDIEPVYQVEQVCFILKCNEEILSMSMALIMKCVVKQVDVF